MTDFLDCSIVRIFAIILGNTSTISVIFVSYDYTRAIFFCYPSHDGSHFLIYFENKSHFESWNVNNVEEISWFFSIPLAVK